MTQRVLVLGGTGMLGAMMVRVLKKEGMEVGATTRANAEEGSGWHHFSPLYIYESSSRELLRSYDWLINCIGITKPDIDEVDSVSIKRAVEINSLFPYQLADCLTPHQRVIQIATDCVFSGRGERSYEETPHDALDVYGKTKSLGEVNLPNIMHLRTSIIGPEFREQKKFLLEWFLGQPQVATVQGFANHGWNGITTLQFAKVCAGIIRKPGLSRAGVQHLVPASGATKASLLGKIGVAFGRQDIVIESVYNGDEFVNRYLETNDPSFNRHLWQGAGYEHPPDLETMLTELAAWQQPGSPVLPGSR